MMKVEAQIVPNISVDCVIFGYDSEGLRVLLRKELLRYQGEVFVELKLPGNHVYQNETVEESVKRVLYEQTGFENIYIQQFGVFSDPRRLLNRKRDYEWIRPGGLDTRVITIGFFSLINLQDINEVFKDEAIWTCVYQIEELLFDHKEILDSALEHLRHQLLQDPIAFELLPEKFTLTELQKLYESIFHTEFDKRNFRRKIAKMKYLIPLEEHQTGVSHKPARFYSFNRNIYEETRSENFDFGL